MLKENINNKYKEYFNRKIRLNVIMRGSTITFSGVIKSCDDNTIIINDEQNCFTSINKKDITKIIPLDEVIPR